MSDRGSRIVKLCERVEVPHGGALRVCPAGEPAIAVVNVDGTFHALADECTHGAGSLCDGFVDRDVIVCPLHAGEFHVPSGKALDLPVTVDVRTYAVWVEGEAVMADLGRSSGHPPPE